MNKILVNSNYKNNALLALLITVIFSACDSSPKPVEITTLTEYKDDIAKFSILYPSNWSSTKQQGERFIVFSSNDAKSRFNQYDSYGFPGAMIDVYVTKLGEGKNEDSVISKAKRFGNEYYKTSSITVDGVQGKRLDYGFELEGGEFKGLFIIASKDSITYTTLKIESFDNSWNNYKDDFDKIIASLKLAETRQKKQDTVTITEELPFPSEKLVQQKGTGFTISIPDNFYLGKPNSTNVIAAYNYIGDRRADCNIAIDVLDGSKTSDLKKAATELASRYTGSSAISAVKIGGLEGFSMTWKPTKDVKGRVYFAKKHDKIFRVSINWFSPEENNYLPIFEKSIASLKFE
jgi:hypothetical protein